MSVCVCVCVCVSVSVSVCVVCIVILAYDAWFWIGFAMCGTWLFFRGYVVEFRGCMEVVEISICVGVVFFLWFVC